MPVWTNTAPDFREPGASPDGYRTGDAPAGEIVVGVDGSSTALSAVRWAAEEAGARQAPLRIVHAATYLGKPASPSAAPPELPRARRISARAYTVARHAAPWTPISTAIAPIEPVPALLRASQDGQLLVLGISTTGALDELVVASVTQRVAARSACPVTVVPRSRPDATGRPVVAVLGLPGGADDEAVAAFAAAASRRAGRPLRLLHTRDGRTPDADTWAARLRGIQVQHRDVRGATAVDLLAAAGPTPLLVLPTGRPGVFDRSLDGQHRWLLRHCTSPIALLPSSYGDSGSRPSGGNSQRTA